MNNNNNNNMAQLEYEQSNPTGLNYTYEQLKGKTVYISLMEDNGEGGYDESIEGISIKTMDDYNTLEQTIANYEAMGILDEYFVSK